VPRALATGKPHQRPLGLRRAERLPAPCCGSARHGIGSAVSRHHPHDARCSGEGFGAATRSEFAVQRQPCARWAAFERLATPMPFSAGSFRVCASGSGQRTTVVIETNSMFAGISVQNLRPHDAHARAYCSDKGSASAVATSACIFCTISGGVLAGTLLAI
jgi:hypothetical protein